MIANLFNVPSTEEDWNEYSFSLQSTLRDINRRIYETQKIAVPEFILDPINLAEPYVQLYNLQNWMNDLNAILGIAGFDYIDVDFSQQGDLASWTWLLAKNIRQAANQVGIG
ncbi:MAG: hypothetical protein KGJ13_09295 [Patescibacteria group bacterium]|nr:hypothetical protein [Patescibacteria group bacterium]